MTASVFAFPILHFKFFTTPPAYVLPALAVVVAAPVGLKELEELAAQPVPHWLELYQNSNLPGVLQADQGEVAGPVVESIQPVVAVVAEAAHACSSYFVQKQQCCS